MNAATPLDRAIIADEAEAAAFADLYDAAPASLKAQLGLRVEQVAGAVLLLAPGIPAAMFNRGIGLGLRTPARDADVAAIAQAYRHAGCKSWWLHWNPHSLPAEFPVRLGALGFTQPARRSWAKVLRGPGSVPAIATDLRIGPARADEVDGVMKAIVTAFEMPPFMAQWLGALRGRDRWRLYAVKDGEQVVGGGCLYLDGKTAWLGMGSVLPSHRRRGGQGALMARRISDAIEAGAVHIVTETGEPVADEPNPSLANMKRCGFETVASRLNYAGPA